ncbi:putative cyclophilin [Cyclospora cayetanensis]|uniref:Cyclophilin n=1 Tax=Cyclospora cayetanensis TaxID=88456 RepID=A0A1D3CXS5_9EIME|nr:putative cyclophilin [Cyclospora cayetanensis]
MSEVYANEPATSGKVVLHTTMGPLDVELWAREAPRTTRSFVQLCMEGYYDNSIFHRLLPGFIIQGGDPTGTGKGGASIYDAAGDAREAPSSVARRESSLTLELNSRLRFRYRGLMGAASKEVDGSPPGAAPHIGSQFFFTLGRADSLNGKYTLFGKVSGPSLFNLLRMGELPVDKHDRPKDPPKIVSTEVLWNPFGDIVPRSLPLTAQQQRQDAQQQHAAEEQQQRELRPQLAVANASLLSFADEEEALLEQQQQQQQREKQILSDQQQQQKKQILSDQQQRKPPLSAHDLLTDPKLSKAAAPPSAVLQLHPNSARKAQTSKQRQAETLEKLKAFREQRDEAIEAAKATAARVAEPVTLGAPYGGAPNATAPKEEDEGGSPWFMTGGLSFAVDSSTAYKLDEARNNLEVRDPLKNRRFEEDTKAQLRKKSSVYEGGPRQLARCSLLSSLSPLQVGLRLLSCAGCEQQLVLKQQPLLLPQQSLAAGGVFCRRIAAAAAAALQQVLRA